jgi:cell division protein FtsL
MSPGGSSRRIVLNERLVKERDAARVRELRRVLALCAALLVPVLFYVWQQVEYIRTGYRIEALREEKAKLVEWGRKLRLERATLLDLRRIEKVAVERLRLVPPTEENTRKVRLAGESEQPAEVAAQRRAAPAGGVAAAEF